MKKVFPIILSGGAGTRLWPLSRACLPKQFLDFSSNVAFDSLFQNTLKRIYSISSQNIAIDRVVIVTNDEYRFLAQDQLSGLKNIPATLLLEPLGKNTAPALTFAALYAQQQESDPILVVTPADHAILNHEAYSSALKCGIDLAEQGDIVIFGVRPAAPETGYGYIKAGCNKSDITRSEKAFAVEAFVEKPSIEKAKQYLSEGGYYWNSGIFMLKTSVWLAAIQKFRADIFSATKGAWDKRSEDYSGNNLFVRPDETLFKTIPSESIDYAVIEKCFRDCNQEFSLKMIELDAGWNDLGSWDAVWQEGQKDVNGNVITGDVLVADTSNSLVHSTNRLICTVGVDNLIIIETADAVLVADRKNSQNVKFIVEKLAGQKREEKNLHRKVFRPWGFYDSVDEGDQFKVKRISVKPGASLSLQMHHHRAEHWIVVKGTAEITNGKQVFSLAENESTYIPKGQTHRLSNPGSTILEIIEVQSGSYLGEDDIVRFEDSYGRT